MAETGIVGLGPVHVVDAAGSVHVLGRAGSIDWWVGADDRWHTASTEAAIRQGFGDDETTIETRLRVPGGDIVQRICAVPDHGRGVLVVELENATPVPVAVALVIPADGPVEVFDDTMSVGGQPCARASRSVARVFVAGDRAALEAGVVAGEAIPPSEADQPWAGTHAALIFPLPHTAVLRCAISFDGDDRLTSPNDLPPVDAVVRGWAAHLDAGADFSLPDERLRRLVAAARRHLLMGSAQPVDAAFWADDVEPWVPAVAAAALDRWGHPIEARELLLAATGPDDLLAHAGRGLAEAGSLLWAWADRLERQPDPELERVLVPWIEQAAIGLMGKRRRWSPRRDAAENEPWRAVGLAAAGSLLSRAGNETLGPDILDALPALVAEGPPPPTSVPGVLGAHRLGVTNHSSILAVLGALLGSRDLTLSGLAARSSPTGSLAFGARSQHPMLSALALLAIRDALVDEPEGSGGVVALLGGLDAAWLGAPMEGHRFPVAGGHVSFGVRWHEERPALLWDLSSNIPDPRLSAPALDGGWTVEEARGEALLAPTSALAAEPAPESPRVRRGDVVDPGETPESFA